MSHPSTPSQPPSTSPSSSTRSRNQLVIYLTGATLLTLSTHLTRRSLLHRHKSTIPRFYHPSNAQPSLSINGRLEAYQALGLATMNVASLFVMMGGGLLWAFDVGGVEELKRRVEGRRRGVDGRWKGRGKDDDEEGEFEKWVASLTGRGEREEEKGGRRRRWSAQEANEEEEGRAREGRFAVVEAQATNERRKPR